MSGNGSIEDRIHKIESRLATLESALGYIEQKPKSSAAAPASTMAESVPRSAVTSQPVSAPAVPSSYASWSGTKGKHESAAKRPDMGNWLGVIGIVCFVLAAAFIVKLAIDSGWLTPARQIGLAAVFGLSLIGTGFKLLDTDKEYASLLPSAGIIVLYLSVYAAYSWHGLLSFDAALGASAAVSVACIWIYTSIRHDIYPVTAAVGAYLAPLLFGDSSQTTFTLYYFIACSIAFSWISAWLNTRTAAIVAAYLAIGATVLVGAEFNDDLALIGLLAFHFVLFSAGTVAHTVINRQPLTETEAWSFFPVLLFFYGAEYHFINRYAPEAAPWISLAFAGFLIGIYLFARKTMARSLVSQQVIVAFATVVLFHSGYLELLLDDARPWLAVAFILLGAFRPAREALPSKGIQFPLFAAVAVVTIEYLRMLFQLLEPTDWNWLVVSFVTVVALLGFFRSVKADSGEKNKAANAVLLAAHVLATVALFRVLENSGSLAVSAGWLSYAVLNMGYGFFKRDATMARSALLVLALAAGKALLYDAASAPTVVRILCLMLTGAVLYGCGLLLRNISSWEVGD